MNVHQLEWKSILTFDLFIVFFRGSFGVVIITETLKQIIKH